MNGCWNLNQLFANGTRTTSTSSSRTKRAEIWRCGGIFRRGCKQSWWSCVSTRICRRENKVSIHDLFRSEFPDSYIKLLQQRSRPTNKTKWWVQRIWFGTETWIYSCSFCEASCYSAFRKYEPESCAHDIICWCALYPQQMSVATSYAMSSLYRWY